MPIVEVNNCECGKDQNLDTWEDAHHTVYCTNCFEIVSYMNESGKSPSKRTKKEIKRGDSIKQEKSLKHLFKHTWHLSEDYPKETNGLNVFGTFICGGGSTMGYKLAGYNHLGGVEVDEKIYKVYKHNHKPKHIYNIDVRDFLKLGKKIPKELYKLDILDGSPPCSSFSMSGSREDGWGKKKKFREGQTEQTLDDLFFHFIDIAYELQPKVVVAENVKGILMGNAKKYCEKIIKEFGKAGYVVENWTLDASKMGVPQARERVFFIAIRKDIRDVLPKNDLFSNYPIIDLHFKEPAISFKEATKDFWGYERKPLTDTAAKYYFQVEEGKAFSTVHEEKSFFNWMKVAQNKPIPTIGASNYNLMFHPVKEGSLNERELMTCGTYPQDYQNLDVELGYLIGMSVPPVMIAQIAKRLKTYIFDKL